MSKGPGSLSVYHICSFTLDLRVLTGSLQNQVMWSLCGHISHTQRSLSSAASLAPLRLGNL
jgi:hypothetical protein